jgi:hypothetical protein
MNQRDDFFLGGAAPIFQGDRTLTLRSIPANARIVKATVTVTPQSPPFTVDISFNGTGPTFGATNSEPGGWAEVDFHARRTLVSVAGTNLNGTTLQADFGGGVYVDISETGAVKGPEENPFTFTSSTGGPLPSLTVARFKLTKPAGVPTTPSPSIRTVTIRAVPSNVSLRTGDLGPFWTHLGDMTLPETTPDFATVLQGFLAKAAVENGFYVVPLILHSDSLGKLAVTVNTEFVPQQTAIPGGLKDVVLPYDLSSVAQPQADVLQINVPRNTRIVPGQTSARIKGAFEETRVASGPTGAVEPKTEVAIPAGSAQAQPIMLTDPTAVTAIDLLLKAVGGSARLRLDVRSDLAGKPDDGSLLPQPAELTLDPKPNAAFAWVSVPLSAEFRFQPNTHYWLVLQTLQGNINWSADPATPPSAGMQRTQDGGLSWRITTPVAKSGASAAGAVTGPLAGYFRLRSKPATFQVPIEVQAGSGKNAVRIKLDRFAPMGRVDFSPGAEIAQALNGSLDKIAQDSPPPCPEGEHIANGEFKQQVELANEQSVPSDWTFTGTFKLEDEKAGGHPTLTGESGGTPIDAALSQVVPISPSCRYELSLLGRAEHSDPDAVAEIFWLDQQCNLQQTDSIPFHETQDVDDLARHRIRAAAPAGATQAEVRFRVPAGKSISLNKISLQVAANALLNSDLQSLEGGLPAGWNVTPDTPPNFIVRLVQFPSASETSTAFANLGTSTVELFQRVEVKSSHSYVFDFEGASGQNATFPARPQAELRWQSQNGTPLEPAIVFEILSGNASHSTATGVVPSQAVTAEIHLILPPKSDLVVQNIFLQLSQPQTVPLTFIAQAPGQLTVSDLRVGFEHVPTPPPPVPATGLCPPTPPGKTPGEKDCESSHCCCCGEKDTMVDAAPTVTPANRPAMIGKCSNCGSTVITHGGKLPVPGEARVPFPTLLTVAAKPVPKPPTKPVSPPLTAIAGIGKRRAEQLIHAGIDSMEKLATASPADVANAMAGVSIKNAPHFIDAARKLLQEPQASREQHP